MSVFNNEHAHIKEITVFGMLDHHSPNYPLLDPDNLIERLKDRTSDNPYHNYQHCYQVAINASDGAIYHGADEKTQFILFLAGLFHDSCYQCAPAGVKAEDQEVLNIKTATDFAVNEIGVFAPEFIDNIKILIEATRFPRVKKPGISLGEQIVADSDLLQNVANDRLEWWEALSEETGMTVTEETTETWLLGNLDNLFHTDWAKDLVKQSFKTS